MYIKSSPRGTADGFLGRLPRDESHIHGVISFRATSWDASYDDDSQTVGFEVKTYCNQEFKVEEIVVLKPRHNATFDGWCMECLRLQGQA